MSAILCMRAAGETKKKIDVAKEVLAGIVGLLRPDDSLSVVLFSDAACVPKPLGPVRCADVDKLKEQVGRRQAAAGQLPGWLQAGAESPALPPQLNP